MRQKTKPLGPTGQLLSRIDSSTFARERSGSAKKACFLSVYPLPLEPSPRASATPGLAGHEREEFLLVEGNQVGISRRGSEFPARCQRPSTMTALFRRKSGANLGSSTLRGTRSPP